MKHIFSFIIAISLLGSANAADRRCTFEFEGMLGVKSAVRWNEKTQLAEFESDIRLIRGKVILRPTENTWRATSMYFSNLRTSRTAGGWSETEDKEITFLPRHAKGFPHRVVVASYISVGSLRIVVGAQEPKNVECNFEPNYHDLALEKRTP
jgi:hypothetical protein